MEKCPYLCVFKNHIFMKCINCFREIDDGLKFCPKCGFKQPDDREAYELEHPELADAIPEEDILEKMKLSALEPRTAMTREEFVEMVANDPHHESIIKIVDEGIEKFAITEQSDQERWHAKCAGLIGDKQGFYPYFVMLLSQQYEMARDLLLNQASYGMDFAPATKEEEAPELPSDIPELPPPLPLPHNATYGYPYYNPGYIQSASASSPINNAYGSPVVCPICHNRISPGTTECPFCHQLLDWKDDTQGPGTGDEENKENYMWVLPVIIIVVLILLVVAASNCSDNKKPREDPYNYAPTYYDYSTESAEIEEVETMEPAKEEDQNDPYYDNSYYDDEEKDDDDYEYYY